MKKLLAACALTLGLIGTANALLPLGAAFVWLGTAASSSTSLATALEASVYIHAGAIAVYSLFFADKDSSGRPTGPAIEVKLNNVAARSNPDPSKWDDAVAGQRDPTPKSSVAPQSPPPTGGALVGGAQAYVSNCAGSGNVYASSVAGIGAACARVADMSWNGASYKPSYSVTCGATSCVVHSTGCADFLCPPGDVTVNASAVTAPAGVNCSSGMYNAGTSQCLTALPTDCPAGYALSGTSCVLSDASQVKKPATWPCEVLRTSSGLEADPANPNCSGVDLQGGTLQLDQQAIAFNSDGSVSVSNPNGQTKFQIGSQNSDGSVTVTGITRTGTPGTYPGTGGGGTGGDGGSEGDGDSCGLPGGPKCQIDESGTPSGSGAFSGAGSALNTVTNDLVNALGTVTSDAGKDTSWGWFPQLPSGTCTPFELGVVGTQPLTVDWCPIVPTLKEITSWMFGLLTVLSILHMVHSTIRGGGS